MTVLFTRPCPCCGVSFSTTSNAKRDCSAKCAATSKWFQIAAAKRKGKAGTDATNTANH